MSRLGETPAERMTRLTATGGWIGVDLDGSLAEYHGWRDDGGIGAPVAKMMTRVQAWLAAGIEVKILTARVSGFRERPAQVIVQRALIEQWCLQHVGRILEVTNEKDYNMIVLYDDRAIQLIENTGERADGVED
jgi:hypothetical protein